MPTVDQNKDMFDREYDWPHAGDEWSRWWGSAEMQWHTTILPRIHFCVPTGTILEIAPGFGRWTQFLAENCTKLVLVDLSERCIRACEERFRAYEHISYHVNDGACLDFVPDESIDLVFSFDSLVHAEDDVIAAYLDQLAHKLTADGVGVIHHSNLGEYTDYVALLERVPWRLKKLLTDWNLLDTLEGQWRAPSMTAHRFEQCANNAGLQCTSQEIMNWESRRLIDCISVFTRQESRWARKNRVSRNKHFMREAAYSAILSRLYGRQEWAVDPTP
jgi:SAM-dependent methyltransferase